MSEFSLVRVNQGMRKAFITAWESAFSRSLEASIYDWIFDDNNIMYALLAEREIAAGYCLYPLECYWKGSQSTALLCNNVFVCPSYQGKHLFVKIGKAALIDASSKKYGTIAYGIPNALALPGHARVGWGVQRPIRFLQKKRRKYLGSAKNMWVFGNLNEYQIDGIENCSRVSGRNRSFSIIKSSAFVKWRYESKPGVKYWFGFAEEGGKVVAYVVCKYYPAKETLHIIDIDGERDEKILSLIEEVEMIPEPFHRINVWESTAKKNIFVKYGYELSDETDNFIAINMGNLRSILIEDDCNLCLGDNDVY